MEVYHLPEVFNADQSAWFKVHDYQTASECRKQMVSLQQNTFSFLLEGSKEVFADKSSVAIENSNFLLMKMGHCLMTEKLPNAKDHYRSMLFFFSNEALLDFIGRHKITVPHPLETNSIYAFEYDNFLHTFVKGLIDITKLPIKLQSKLLEVKFEELLVYLLEMRGPHFLFALLPQFNSQVQHFMEVIETNKLNKLSLSELAFLANMSLSTFKRTFKKQFQQPPSKWFQDQRLTHAAFLLKHHLQRPSDIFEEVGYESLSNFIQAFKNKYGVTPKQYQLD